jgi:hypothetical protein
LREPDKTLDDLLTMRRALEMADAQSLTMERDSVNKVHTTQCPQPHKPRGCNENIRHINLHCLSVTVTFTFGVFVLTTLTCSVFFLIVYAYC